MNTQSFFKDNATNYRRSHPASARSLPKGVVSRFACSLYLELDRDKIQLVKDVFRRNKPVAVAAAFVVFATVLVLAWDWITHHLVITGGILAFFGCMALLLRPYIDARKASRMMESRMPDHTVSVPYQFEQCPFDEKFKDRVYDARKRLNEVVLASIDASGRAHSPFGEFPFLPNVTANDFVDRDRFDIDIVLVGNDILLRKHFRGNLRHFAKEWIILEYLFGKARVPVVRKAIQATTTLYMDFVCGRTVLEILRDHGAKMRDSDVDQDPRFEGLEGVARQRALDAMAQDVIPKALPEETLTKIDKLIEDIHAAHISDLDIRFANIILDLQGNPWFIDLHDARRYSGKSLLFLLKRDGDVHLYNRVFCRDLQTIRDAKIPSAAMPRT